MVSVSSAVLRRTGTIPRRANCRWWPLPPGRCVPAALRPGAVCGVAAAARWLRPGLVLAAAVLAPGAPASAQELEPRAYSNAPVGMNFFVAGYGYSGGGVAFDPSVPLADADIAVHTALFAIVAIAWQYRWGAGY